MDNEEEKQTPRRVSFTDLHQVESDHVMAMALQEQERTAFTTLPDIESDSSNEEESEEYSSEEEEEDYDSNDYEFFQSIRELEAAELEFLEGEGSNNNDDDEMEEDDVDVDELSYEELIALGEFIGEEKRGMSVNEISTCLRQFKCRLSADQNNERADVDRCVVCQLEYEEGEALVGLPCEHPFHSECISMWLQIKKLCPICSTEVSSPKTTTSGN
ncbi:E3 ubiquitin ligase BIG BROTHER-related-like [Tripterygium wilfordii]|uniref:E3 ubiquitin ligase BIG BROTHER-related-like n=1 Tax=Tripterygium wilfordii TaxID=458696 RepID=A0A7J7DSC6_TRIWF|nr:E3 ubiquitin ligase BIG BROTHER-related-like [Tripterygium wilfordii]KAF5749044.1 E3 ubiquitin ligase BIG BROTHER-related-like [Tripterygium wilfordii]